MKDRSADVCSPAVFLDRDGTINFDSGYVTSPSELFLLPGAAEAIGMLKRAGFAVVVTSNQSAIGRGLASETAVRATNDRLRELLRAEDRDAELDFILYCPHHPDEKCDCRKPHTGMVDHSPFAGRFAPTASWMVGDKLTDLDFGLALKLPPSHLLLVNSGDGAESLRRAQEDGRSVRAVPDLRAAAELILGECKTV